MDRPEIILAPGPTPIPPEVLLAQAAPLVYHRGPGFGSMLREVTEQLKTLYKTQSDVVILTSSGTGGLESAIANCFSPGDEVLVPLAGFFSERFAKLARAYGLTVRTIDYEWGRSVKAADVAAALAEHPVKAVLLTHSETSTGVVHDLEPIARAAKDAGALVLVDAVSSLGAVPFDMDGWGIDVAISGSQKALSASPGLAFVAISDAAWAAQRTAINPRFYFDWATYKTFYALPDPENPWTPAISVVQGLHKALELYFQDGPDAAFERHALLSRAIKEGVRSLGLDLFGEDVERAWTVTAIRAPEGIDADTICARIRADHAIVLAPGQGPLKGKVFRIGHIGYY
ncbi:MAG: pyridoxal-phosphate-dependent aminotransferase family protein, partial [Actinomycetota bacterium]